MGKLLLCRSYEGTRIRLQRLTDLRFFTGWVADIFDDRITVRVNGYEEFEPQEEFFLQVFGDGQTAMFRAMFDTRAGSRSSFLIKEVPQIISSSEIFRVKVADLKCTVKIGWFETLADVIDLSPNGLGIQTLTSVDKGEVVALSMFTSFGEIRGKGEVCYSRTSDGLTGSYRIGIEMYPLDRLNQAKWNQLIKLMLPDTEAA